MGNFFEPQVLSEGGWQETGYEDMITSYLQNLQDREAPETPISQQAANQMQQTIGLSGPLLEQFYGGMLAHGGMQDTLGLSRDLYETGMEDQIANIMSQGRGGTANMRALGRATTQGSREFALGTAREAQRNKYMGAQGLGGMPGYYAQPSSVEQAMFAMQTPYDMMNMQNEAQIMAMLAGQSHYSDPIYGPSPFDAFVSPFLSAGMEGGTGYMTGMG